MSDWMPSESDLKKYPHFDKYLPIEEILAIVNDPERVRTNKFYPFLRYIKSWNRFTQHDDKKVRAECKKERPIRYAGRRDAYIFSYYRYLLSAPYEDLLDEQDLSKSVLAYRKIPVENGSRRGKCNIHFAHDAFSAIDEIGDCSVVALDISSYFETIDHERLRRVWCRLVQDQELPPDHLKVFEAITRYAVIDRDSAYERLGYVRRRENGSLEHVKKVPMQICSPAEFRRKICGGDTNLKSLVRVNRKPYGIPQGSPISDLLANAYLIDFDRQMKEFTEQRGGRYFRYSDDILVILPGGRQEGRTAKRHTIELIRHYGAKLEIQERKTSLLEFKVLNGQRTCSWVEEPGTSRTNGLEYLGFRYAGDQVFIRDSTLSGFQRKVTFTARKEARKFVARYPGKDLSFLSEEFPLEEFIRRFGRVQDFDECRDYHRWTFWTYAKRASEIFGRKGHGINRQMRNHRSQISEKVERELGLALHRRPAVLARKKAQRANSTMNDGSQVHDSA